jgi:hypothetical protein
MPYHFCGRVFLQLNSECHFDNKRPSTKEMKGRSLNEEVHCNHSPADDISRLHC